MHHSYGPTMVLVTHPLIGSSIFASWSIALLIALCGKNKESFFDGTITKSTLVSKLHKSIYGLKQTS